MNIRHELRWIGSIVLFSGIFIYGLYPRLTGERDIVVQLYDTYYVLSFGTAFVMLTVTLGLIVGFGRLLLKK